MNELIEEMFEQYARLFMNDKCEILFTDFEQAIQTACKAQRNACKRVYADNLFDDTYTAIANAEIKRKDYE